MQHFDPYGAGFMPPRKAFTAALRVLIISACSRTKVATTPFARLYKLPEANVRYHFSQLEKEGILRICDEERIGGFWRRYYVAVHQRAYMDEEFARLVPKERQGVSLGVLWDLAERCREARDAGTIDALDGSHLSRFDLALDPLGWTEVMAELMRNFERGFEIQADALGQLKAGHQELIPITYALAGFEGPQAVRRPPGETPLSRRRGPSWAVAANFSAHAMTALREGTMDERSDSHLTWSPFVLSRQSWHDLSSELRLTRERIMEIQVGATARLALHGGEPIPTTVALIGFKSAGIYKPGSETTLTWPPQELDPIHR
jgi:DNA-binding transcriptional ArsR family regulator